MKSLALGADLVGLSNRILQYVKDGKMDQMDKVFYDLSVMNGEIRDIMTLLGAKILHRWGRQILSCLHLYNIGVKRVVLTGSCTVNVLKIDEC